MHLDCGGTNSVCEKLVDEFLNSYCESVKLPAVFVAPTLTTQGMTHTVLVRFIPDTSQYS